MAEAHLINCQAYWGRLMIAERTTNNARRKAKKLVQRAEYRVQILRNLLK